MISKQTCYHIWNCHNEIEKANELFKAMAEKLANDEEKKAPELDDVFGRAKGMQLGVPWGDSGHTLYGVGIEMGVKVIEQHIKDKQARLIELMTIARIELNA